jgi:hypothetical protein
MHKETFKQKVLKSIGNLPQDASLEDVILKIYIIHNDENQLSQGENDNYGEYEDLIRNFAIN